MKHPIDAIEWVHVGSLTANSYNPNHVQPIEMKLLEHSLIVDRWLQPIIVCDEYDDEGKPILVIVDGFHRATLAKTSAALLKRDQGFVPTVKLKKTRAQAMATTIRMNRAKGTHAAIAMSDLVRELIDEHGLSVAAIAQEIGATKEEVELLNAGNIFKARKLEGRDYSRAWEPREDGRYGKNRAAFKP